MRIRQAWLTPGGPKWPDREKAKRWGMDRLYWEARDPQLDADMLNQIRKAPVNPVGVGLMFGPNWYGWPPPAKFAKIASDRLTELGFGPNTSPDSCAVLFDIENHDDRYIESSILEFRKLRWSRTLLWTMECFQGGGIDQQLANVINNDINCLAVPQAYIGRGGVVEVPVDTHVMHEDLQRWIPSPIKRDRVKSFYAPNFPVPYGWDGIVFGFNELPSAPVIAL